MDTCVVETGFLKKKPCGRAAVTRCLNCEIPLCAEHAVAETSASGAHTGKFLCQECKVALKEHEARLAALPKKPAANPAAKPAAKPAAPAEPQAPADKKPDSGGLDFK